MAMSATRAGDEFRGAIARARVARHAFLSATAQPVGADISRWPMSRGRIETDELKSIMAKEMEKA